MHKIEARVLIVWAIACWVQLGRRLKMLISQPLVRAHRLLLDDNGGDRRVANHQIIHERHERDRTGPVRLTGCRS